MSEKNRMIFNLMEDWIRLYRKNICIVPYLKMQKVSSVAIYGYGRIGRLIAEELEESGRTLLDYIKQTYHYRADRVSKALSTLTDEEELP